MRMPPRKRMRWKQPPPSASGQPSANSSVETLPAGLELPPATALSPAVLRRSTPCKHLKPKTTNRNLKSIAKSIAKRRKLDIERANSSDRCVDTKTAEVSITVRAMSGAVLYNRCIQSSSSGKWLLDQVLQQHPRSGSGVGKLLHEKVHIDASKPLGEQGVTDGSELAMVWLPVQLVVNIKDVEIPRVLKPLARILANSIKAFCCTGLEQDENYKVRSAYYEYVEWRRRKGMQEPDRTCTNKLYRCFQGLLAVYHPDVEVAWFSKQRKQRAEEAYSLFCEDTTALEQLGAKLHVSQEKALLLLATAVRDRQQADVSAFLPYAQRYINELAAMTFSDFQRSGDSHSATVEDGVVGKLHGEP